MKLDKLLKGIEYKINTKESKDIEIDIISMNAQTNLKKGLFFCFEGSKNGYELIDLAIQNGAIAIVCEKPVDKDIIQIIVSNVRSVIGIISQNFYGTSSLKVIGVTGTNGKTTTTFLIKNILECAGKKVGIIGTTGIYFGNEFIPAKLTTPDPTDLHEIFSIMKQGKVDYVVMEVSAHAIELNKVNGVNFVCKILTNVTQDHLDFFKTMDRYKDAKLRFFNKNDLMIVNSDDWCGQEILRKFDTAISYGLNNPSDAFCIEINKECTNYIMNICDNVIDIQSKLYGLFNVYNSMAAATCCYFLGVNENIIKKGLEQTDKVDGRFNVIEFDEKKVVVDFAHTPDGLENVLKAARQITYGKLFCLFGCGGNRDKSKRKVMGAISEKYADFCYITSDNPRYEVPLEIINDIITGFNSKRYYAIEDRKMAISVAINSLNKGDTLLVCGKGCEDYIDIKGQKIPYSDTQTINQIIEEIRC